MIKRLLGILALVGLMLLATVITVSAPGSGGQSQQELMVTINEVCRVTFDFDYSGVTYHDNLSATFQERNVYRITRYDNGEDRADLELVSHHKDLSPGGVEPTRIRRCLRIHGPTKSTKILRMLQSPPLTGVEVSFTGGWLKVSVPNNPCGFVKASSIRGVLGGVAHDNDGYATPPR